MTTKFYHLSAKVQTYIFISLLLLGVAISENAYTQWAQTQFIIGTYFDPCLSAITDTNNTAAVTQDTARFRTAKAAYFNLLTGTQSSGFINQTQAGMDYALYIASKVGLKYLVYDNRFFHSCTCPCPPLGPCPENKPFDQTIANAVISHYTGLDPAKRNAMYGYNIFDEPPDYNPNFTPHIKNWISYFKANDNSKLAYINLWPSYAFGTDRNAYETYLDLYLNDATNPNSNPDVVSFDYYPFHLSGTRMDYFYNLNIIKKKAGTRPFWVYPMSTGHVSTSDPTNGYVDPDSTHLRFMVFCPIAYGAKGLIYYTYEQPPSDNNWTNHDAIINDCNTQTSTYGRVRTINHYVTKIVAPVVMNSTNLGAFHKSNSPTNESISCDQKINPKTPLVSDLNNNNAMVGVFRDKVIASTYYGLLVNKGTAVATINVTVTLKGDHRNKVTLAPSVKGYTGSTSYISASPTYNSTTNKTTFTVSLSGGEGRIFKVTGVTNPYIATSRTDYDGDRKADLSVKTDGQAWKIDYAANGFGSFDATYNGYGTAVAQPVPADYDGDGKADLSVKVDNTGQWLIDYASSGFGSWNATYNGYGDATQHAVPADYDGDGKADLSVKTDGGVWKIDYASDGFGSFVTYSGYGTAIAQPVPADYDGDGKADLSVKVDNTGQWLIDYACSGFGSWNATYSGYGGADEHGLYKKGKDQNQNEPGSNQYYLSHSPNPFNPTTTIFYTLPKAAHVKIVIYSINGEEVVTLVDEEKGSGSFTAVWNGRNKLGRNVGSGTYIYRMQSENFTQSRKMLLLR